MPKPPYSPYANRDFPTRPFFGDTHLHTSFSMDAGAFGARLGPKEAYRFARGEQLTASSGQPVKLSRPLDFLVVADHSDNMGFFPDLFAGKPELLADPTGRQWYDLIQSGRGAEAALEIIGAFSQGTFPKDLMYMPGTRPIAAPGRRRLPPPSSTTSRAASPPSSATNGPRTPAATTCTATSSSATTATGRARSSRSPCIRLSGATIPEELWKWMQAYEQKTGGSVLAIAHNGNLSNGLMFPIVEAFGKRIDRAYAEQRTRWERLYETTQTKGDGEAHPFLSPNDEFANFERWDFGNLDASVAKTREMLEFEYARSALKNGLKLGQTLGVNPYKFGLIGSSDAHTGLAAMEEDNFFGKTTPQEPSPERMLATFMNNPKTGIKIMDWQVSSSGYAAVWAKENTASLAVGCHAAPGDLCHDRAAHDRAVLRRLGLRRAGRQQPSSRLDRLHQGRADGRRAAGAAAGQVTHLPGGGAEGSARREPRPLPDRQGLADKRRQARREGL